MAGGGVGEAMLIGAAVGAGTGAVSSAVQDKDILQGALLGGAMGAAGGGIGSSLGGAASGALEAGTQTAATEAASQAGQQAVTNMAQQGAQQAATSMAAMPNLAANQAATSALAEGSTQIAGQGLQQAGQQAVNWGSQGLGQGFAPALTNAQAYGAGAGGGLMGLMGQTAQNQNNMAYVPPEYNGPLSQFSYSPTTFRPSLAPGYADGGITTLGSQAGMFPQSQYDKTQFAAPSQMPISREVIRSDYDATINPYTGDIPKFATGGISTLGSYSDGGRLLRGPGDGMSDDIPASIADKQPARLADGEFVVPADVVSHLGNGSTDSGAKKLYSMMDNVRKARTGSKKQGKQIKAEKYVPGMASGGVAQPQGDGALGWPVEGQSDVGGVSQDEIQAMINASLANTRTAGLSQNFQPTGYTGTEHQYTPYTMANRPSSTQPQYYQDIYQGFQPDYSTPGYTLTGGNLGRWNNVAGEQARAMQPASRNQQVTQAYLQNLGRAPETQGFNYWMQSGLPTSTIRDAIANSGEAQSLGPNAQEAQFISQLYNQYLGRAPEAEGLGFWQSQLGERATADQVRAAIAGSPEAQGRQQAPAQAARQEPAQEEKKRRGGIASLV